MLAGQTTLAGQLLLLAVVLGCRTWRCLLGAGVAPLTLFLSYGYVCVCGRCGLTQGRDWACWELPVISGTPIKDEPLTHTQISR